MKNPLFSAWSRAIMTNLTILTLAASCMCTHPAAGQDAAADSTQQFTFALYEQMAKDAKPDENLFISPVSIHVTLAMVAAGAEKNTEKQMLAALQLPALGKKESAAFGKMLAALEPKSDAYQLAVANRLWGEKGYAFKPAYLETAKKDFLAPLEQLDFSGSPEPSRATINRWVEKQTNDKIKDLLPAGSISSTTRLVLTNAIYFKGTWQREFAKDRTRDAAFFTKNAQRANPAEVKKVPLMYQEANFPAYAADDFQAVALPYQGDRLEMIVLLPRDVEGLAALEKKLTAKFFAETRENLRDTKVKLWLPKFKLEESYEMNDTLIALGMADAFSAEKADFSGMTGDRDLFLSAVYHKSFVDVNEEGTEAAAATAGVMMLRMARPRDEFIFRADHPFIFAIYDRETETVLFLGRMVSP